MQVRREDQEKISRFSSLHQKEIRIEEDLRAKLVRCITPGSQLHVTNSDAWFKPIGILTLFQKEKEDLEEISGELELVDEEEKVPYVYPSDYQSALSLHIMINIAILRLCI